MNALSKQEEVTYEHGEEGIPLHVSCMHGICENPRHSLMETKFKCVDNLTYVPKKKKKQKANK